MQRVGSYLAPLAAMAVILLLVEVAVLLFAIPAYLLPAPSDVLAAIALHGQLLRVALWQTMLAAFGGFTLAAVLGIAVASVMARQKWLRLALYPLANLLQMVPVIAIAPMMTIWLGYGVGSSMACAALVAVFPVIANSVEGLISVDPGLREIFRIYQLRGFKRWWSLELPWATPQIMTGLKIAAGLAVIGAVVGEFVSGYIGEAAPIGIVVLTALREGQSDLVFAAVALSAVLGLLLFALVHGLGWLLLRHWHPSYRGLPPGEPQ